MITLRIVGGVLLIGLGIAFATGVVLALRGGLFWGAGDIAVSAGFGAVCLLLGVIILVRALRAKP